LASRPYLYLLAAILPPVAAPSCCRLAFSPQPLADSTLRGPNTNRATACGFWHKGGNITAIDLWTTFHINQRRARVPVNDGSASGYGEWYSDLLNITGGAIICFRYNLRYVLTHVGPMRVTVNFYNSANTYVSGLSTYSAGLMISGRK